MICKIKHIQHVKALKLKTWLIEQTHTLLSRDGLVSGKGFLDCNQSWRNTISHTATSRQSTSFFSLSDTHTHEFLLMGTFNIAGGHAQHSVQLKYSTQATLVCLWIIMKISFLACLVWISRWFFSWLSPVHLDLAHILAFRNVSSLSMASLGLNLSTLSVSVVTFAHSSGNTWLFFCCLKAPV